MDGLESETEAPIFTTLVDCHAEKRRVSVCVGCGSQIHDQFILKVAPDLEWHASCLKCAECSQYLDESHTCFVRDGKTYCRRDYVRIFGAKCNKCNQTFGKSDFVMRAKNNVYHIDCFRCVACSRQLIPGDEFALRDDGLFCKADHEVVERASSKENGSEDGSPRINNNNNIVTKRANKNNDDNNNNEKGLSLVAGRAEQVSNTKTNGTRSHVHKSEQKPTRIRTVLNEKQLHTLRTCYNANPRPDALMKEQLTEMTNLSPRVIRVWFQNKRCKDKKRSILMKQLQHQQQEKVSKFINGGRLHGPLQGVPMVASSPVRHESPMQANAVEVQSYQPPWKALSDFAMQSELEHPPFQQLMNSFDMEDNHTYHEGYGNEWIHHDQLPDHMDHIDQYSDSEFPETPSEMSSPLSQ
ncbi:insulin gene enhancer protein isl-1-like isoform X1 [Mizuhopecten yessoensis]|uniref:insulin gene enhancer protein isl-1-like isoform X1 n=1 Tax=Mizuhopecten yessoensis TaxID=6573 RepID=UPI000B45BF60|nr:insulin gene enhancer protein isl-1-like isoform X1 [Mizuhopecten yessoensis]